MIRLVLRLALVALSVVASSASAQSEPDAPDSRATTFQAVEGPQKEQVPGGGLLVGAYAFVLVLVIGYVARLGAMQAKTNAEIERLTRAIERGKKE